MWIQFREINSFIVLGVFPEYYVFPIIQALFDGILVLRPEIEPKPSTMNAEY